MSFMDTGQQNHRRMVHGFHFPLPLFSTTPLFSKFSYKSFLVISRKTVDTEYTYYSWCMTSTDIVKWRKNEWLWKFWKRNDLYENFKKKGGSREKGEEETKSMSNAPVNRMTECREIGHRKKSWMKSHRKKIHMKKSHRKKSHIYRYIKCHLSDN